MTRVVMEKFINLIENLNNFRQLEMEKLKDYEVPENIRKVEFDADTSKFEDLMKMIPESRSKDTAYIQLLSAMVHLDEVVNSRIVSEFDLQNIQLVFESHMDRVFKIQYNVMFG